MARCLLLGLAAIVTAVAWNSYRRPGLSLAALAIAVVESMALLWWTGRRRVLDQPGIVWADTGLAVVGLVALGAATTAVDRTTWVNWMDPLTYSVSGAAALAMPLVQGISATLLLAGVYMSTVSRSIGSNRSLAATAVANTASIGGYFIAVRLVAVNLRRASRRVDEARREALAKGQRLAEERERNRQHRLLHDSALQTLEAVARGWGRDNDAQLQRRAAQEAARLRAGIAGEPEKKSGGLRAELAAVASEFGSRGLGVELVADELADEPKPEVSLALRQAVGEALTNVVKHAGVERAVVWAASSPGEGIELIVRDQGVGFDPASRRAGFGQTQSVEARMAEVGGTATVTASPGRGTRVRLWAPN